MPWLPRYFNIVLVPSVREAWGGLSGRKCGEVASHGVEIFILGCWVRINYLTGRYFWACMLGMLSCLTRRNGDRQGCRNLCWGGMGSPGVRLWQPFSPGLTCEWVFVNNDCWLMDWIGLSGHILGHLNKRMLTMIQTAYYSNNRQGRKRQHGWFERCN